MPGMSQRSGLPTAERARDGGPPREVPAGGLSAGEAADRLASYGPNELPRARRTTLTSGMRSQM